MPYTHSPKMNVENENQEIKNINESAEMNENEAELSFTHNIMFNMLQAALVINLMVENRGRKYKKKQKSKRIFYQRTNVEFINRKKVITEF